MSVEREVDKVLTKFSELEKQTNESINDILLYIQNVKDEFLNGGKEFLLYPAGR